MIDYESLLNHEIKAVKPPAFVNFLILQMKWMMSFLSVSENLTFLLPGMFVKKQLILCSKAKHGILQTAVFMNCARKFENWSRENIM